MQQVELAAAQHILKPFFSVKIIYNYVLRYYAQLWLIWHFFPALSHLFRV